MKRLVIILKSFFLLFFVGLTIIGSGCCLQELNQGTVVGKCYVPPKRWIEKELMPFPRESDEIEYYRYESWIITIKGEIDSEETRQDLYVSEEIYNKVVLGDFYTRSPGDRTQPIIKKNKESGVDEQEMEYKMIR